MSVHSNKEAFLKSFDREHATTMKVLQAMPVEKASMKPHPKLRTAQELAYVFAQESGLSNMVLQDKLMDAFSSAPPPAPETWEGTLEAIRTGAASLRERISSMTEEDMELGVTWGTAPGVFEKVRAIDFLWFVLSDQIHHRGQFTVYLRLADAKVPSVYGPSADEPWF
jgi:uncharacterized damage-inducible protein DinB